MSKEKKQQEFNSTGSISIVAEVTYNEENENKFSLDGTSISHNVTKVHLFELFLTVLKNQNITELDLLMHLITRKNAGGNEQ